MVNAINFKIVSEPAATSNQKNSSTQKKDDKFKDLMQKTSENSKKTNTKDQNKSDKVSQADSDQSKPKTEDKKENTQVQENSNEQQETVVDPNTLAMLFQTQQVQQTQQQLPQIQQETSKSISANEVPSIPLSAVESDMISTETFNKSAQNETSEINPHINQIEEQIQTQAQTATQKVDVSKQITVNDSSMQASMQTQSKTDEKLQQNEVNLKSDIQVQNEEIPSIQTQQSEQKQSLTQEESDFGKTQQDIDLLAASKQAPPIKEETVQIKVGEGDTIEPENLKSQMAEKIQDMIVKATGKNNEFEIQLAPEHLGKILVKIAFKQGETSVSLLCSNPKTMSILAENARSISEIVQFNTNTHATINVQEENKSFYDEQGNHQQREQENQQERNQQNKQQNTSIDFIQQMRLGLVDTGNWEKNFQYI